MVVRLEQSARRRRGNLACAGQPQDDRVRNEVFFGGAITSALGHHAGAVRDAGGGGACDVETMLALARTIAHQCRCRAEANQIAARRHQPRRACPNAACHRDCGIGTACLVWCKAEKRRKRCRVVGNLCLDQQPGSAGNTQQLAHCSTAAAGDRKGSLAA